MAFRWVLGAMSKQQRFVYIMQSCITHRGMSNAGLELIPRRSKLKHRLWWGSSKIHAIAPVDCPTNPNWDFRLWCGFDSAVCDRWSLATCKVKQLGSFLQLSSGELLALCLVNNQSVKDCSNSQWPRLNKVLFGMPLTSSFTHRQVWMHYFAAKIANFFPEMSGFFISNS